VAIKTIPYLAQLCYTPSVKPHQDDPQPLLDVQLSQLEITLQEGSAIDAKALGILATNVALLLFMAQGRLYFSEWWQTVFLYGPLFVSLIFNTVVIWPRLYAGPGLTPKQLPRYLQMSSRDRTLQLISTATYGIEANLALNHKRWQFCLLSITFTVIGSGAILLYYI
jgi:hypothetical protein